MNDYKMIYLAHPYGGNEDNIKAFNKLFYHTQLKNKDVSFVSPLKLYSDLYEEMSYADGIDLCLSLLYHCDELWLCGDWQSSKGCIAEYVYAKCNSIPVKYIAYDREFNIRFVDKNYGLTRFDSNIVFEDSMGLL